MRTIVVVVAALQSPAIGCTTPRDESVHAPVPVLVTSQPSHACTVLADDLLAMWKADQDVMLRMMELAKEGTIDSGTVAEVTERANTVSLANTRRLRQLVGQCGWPSISLVGVEPAHAAWGVVQHADHDPKFQRQCLDLMTALVAPGDVNLAEVALLTDRVLRAEGKPQRYGSQVTYVDGRAAAPDLEDPGNVDVRRAKMGLPPLREYLQSMDQFQAVVTDD